MTMEDMWEIENAPSIPARFANVNRTIKPPAPRFTNPRMGEGVPISGTGGVQGIAAPATIGDVDWSVTPWYIDKQTGGMRILPANNRKTGLFGTGELGEETGMTDDEFKLAWAQQLALGKEPPSGWSTRLGRGSDAPSKDEALKLLREKNQFTGALEPEKTRSPRGTAGVGMEAQGTGGPTLGRRLIDFLAGPDDARNQRISSGIQGSPDTYAAPITDEEDPSVRALTPQQIYDMEMDDPTRRGAITPRIALTPEQQLEQQVEAATVAGPENIQFVGGPGSGAPISGSPQASVVVPGITTGTGRSAEARDVERGRPGRPGEGVPISGSTAATTVVPGVMTGTGRSALEQDVERGRPGRPGEGGIISGSPSVTYVPPTGDPNNVVVPRIAVDDFSEMGGEDATAANVPWTPEQWIAAGYTQMPDGSWDIVPAQVPQVTTPTTPPVVTTPTTPPAVVNPAGSQPGGTAVNATWEDVANQRAAEAAAAQAAITTTPASVTAGLPAATAVNMAAGQDPWGTMYQSSLSPRELWEQYRMQQFGDAPLGAQLAAQRNLGYGYEPAMGRFMLGQAAGRITPTAGAFTPGEQFGQYIRGGQQADIDEIRRNYQTLGSYLGSLGGGDPAAGTARYAQVFGAPGSEQDLRGNVLAATRAALGTNAFTGGGALGNIYDVMQRQYGAGGAGRFADWVGTAFQPQQQQPLFQQPANGRQPQLLGTETLQQQSPNWDMQLEDF